MALAEAGAEVGLWACDQSAAVTPLLPATSSVQRVLGTEAEALDCFGETNILHDNGIWLPHNHRFAVLAERRGIPRVNPTQEKRCSSSSNRSLSPGTDEPRPLLWHIDTVRNCDNGDSESEVLHVPRFCLGRCVMATRVFQVAPLI